MLPRLVRSKAQRLVAADKNLKYDGSLELDPRLMRATGILPGERAQLVGVTDGTRFDTTSSRRGPVAESAC